MKGGVKSRRYLSCCLDGVGRWSLPALQKTLRTTDPTASSFVLPGPFEAYACHCPSPSERSRLPRARSQHPARERRGPTGQWAWSRRAGALGMLLHPSSPGSCPATSRSASPRWAAASLLFLPPAGLARQPWPEQSEATQTPSHQHPAAPFSPGEQRTGRRTGFQDSKPKAGSGGAARDHPTSAPHRGTLPPARFAPARAQLCSAQGWRPQGLGGSRHASARPHRQQRAELLPRGSGKGPGARGRRGLHPLPGASGTEMG